METIKNRIDNLLNQYMISKIDFCNKFGVDINEFDSWNSKDPSIKLIPKIAKHLNVPIQNILMDSSLTSDVTYIPKLHFMIFSFCGKDGNIFLSVSYNDTKENGILRFEFDDLDIKFELSKDQDDLFFEACDKCQMINWREYEYGASICDIASFYNEKPYVRPEMFRYRCFMEMFKKLSNELLDEKHFKIINDIDINDVMYFHKGLDYNTTKLVLDELAKTKEEMVNKKRIADELFWDMIG